MKQKKLIAIYSQSTKSYLDHLLSENEIRYVIHSDFEGPEGGVCYVHEEDLEKSIEILKNSEFEFADFNSEPLPIVKHLNSITKKIPLIGGMSLPNRIMGLMSLIVLFLFAILLFNFKTVKRSELIKTQWCILQIENKEGSKIDLSKIKPVMMFEGDCINKLLFKDNTFELSFLASGSWEYLKKNKIKLLDNSSKYNGVYNIERKFKNEIVELKSEDYTIYLKRNIIHSAKIKSNFK